jgi:hypothetical protein
MSLSGENGVGKTAICEWLWSVKDSSALGRWGAYPPDVHRNYHDVKVAIDIMAPARHHLLLKVSGGRTGFVLDDQKFPFSPISYEISSLRRDRSVATDGDQAFIAKCLRMDEISVRALVDYVNDESPGLFLRGADWQENDDEGDYQEFRARRGG